MVPSFLLLAARPHLRRSRRSAAALKWGVLSGPLMNKEFGFHASCCVSAGIHALAADRISFARPTHGQCRSVTPIPTCSPTLTSNPAQSTLRANARRFVTRRRSSVLHLSHFQRHPSHALPGPALCGGRRPLGRCAGRRLAIHGSAAAGFHATAAIIRRPSMAGDWVFRVAPTEYQSSVYSCRRYVPRADGRGV